MDDHEFGEIPHDWLSLHMEIPQQFVTPPEFNEADYVIVNSGTEKLHGACCPKGTCRDVFIRETQMGSREEFDRGLEVVRDHSGDHFFPTSPMNLTTVNRGFHGGAIF